MDFTTQLHVFKGQKLLHTMTQKFKSVIQITNLHLIKTDLKQMRKLISEELCFCFLFYLLWPLEGNIATSIMFNLGHGWGAVMDTMVLGGIECSTMTDSSLGHLVLLSLGLYKTWNISQATIVGQCLTSLGLLLKQLERGCHFCQKMFLFFMQKSFLYSY